MTVRARVTLLAALVVAVVLVVAGFALVEQQRRTLTGSVDDTLESRAEQLVEAGPDGPFALDGLGDDDAIAQVVVDGEVVAASDELDDPDRPIVPVYPPRQETVDAIADEDEPYRIRVEEQGRVVVIVAASFDDVEESVEALRSSLLVAIPLVVTALVVVLWWVVGRALRPVEAIRAEVAGIGARDLHRRVPEPRADDEIGRLARTMNDMLERVDVAAQRQRQFVADASHELRSPLTRIRTELEVDLAGPDDADLRATHASVLEETIGLQRLADDLLLVAREDEGRATTQAVPLDLDDVVLRVARRLRADDRVRVDLSGVSAGHVVGDPHQLARVVGNLADNAVRHAASVVRFSLRADGARVVLTVEDDGPGVPEADRERIFERFARVDTARTATDGGTGLGLAIARDLAEAHGGTLSLDPTAEGARFVLTLPAVET